VIEEDEENVSHQIDLDAIESDSEGLTTEDKVEELRVALRAVALQQAASQQQLETLEKFVLLNGIELKPWGHMNTALFKRECDTLLDDDHTTLQTKGIIFHRIVDCIPGRMYVEVLCQSNVVRVLKIYHERIQALELSIWAQDLKSGGKRNINRLSKAAYHMLIPEFEEVGLSTLPPGKGGNLQTTVSKSISFPAFQHAAVIGEKMLVILKGTKKMLPDTGVQVLSVEAAESIQHEKDMEEWNLLEFANNFEETARKLKGFPYGLGFVRKTYLEPTTPLASEYQECKEKKEEFVDAQEVGKDSVEEDGTSPGDLFTPTPKKKKHA